MVNKLKIDYAYDQSNPNPQKCLFEETKFADKLMMGMAARNVQTYLSNLITYQS